MRRAYSLEKTLILGKTEGKRKGQQRMKWLDCTTDSMDISLTKLWEIRKDRDVWHASVRQRVGHNLANEQHVLKFSEHQKKVQLTIC